MADDDCTLICTDVNAYEREVTSVFRNSAFGEVLLRSEASVINVPEGEFKFPDCDTETPPVIVANETFLLHYK
jgi:hypothetical protein